MLSASTAQIDTAEKLDEYQTIPELEEYVLIDSRRRSIRIYRRKGALFETAPVYTAGHVDFASLATTLAIDEIYEDVSFE